MNTKKNQKKKNSFLALECLAAFRNSRATGHPGHVELRSGLPGDTGVNSHHRGEGLYRVGAPVRKTLE